MPAAILARFVLLEARRGGLPWLAVASIAVALGLAAFLSQVAVTESLALHAISRASRRLCAVRGRARRGLRGSAAALGERRHGGAMGTVARLRDCTGRRGGTFFLHDARPAGPRDRGDRRALRSRPLDGGDPVDRRRSAG